MMSLGSAQPQVLIFLSLFLLCPQLLSPPSWSLPRLGILLLSLCLRCWASAFDSIQTTTFMEHLLCKALRSSFYGDSSRKTTCGSCSRKLSVAIIIATLTTTDARTVPDNIQRASTCIPYLCLQFGGRHSRLDAGSGSS